jgi:hypothetical protein
MAFDVKRGSLLDLKIHKQIAWNIALLGEHNYLNKWVIFRFRARCHRHETPARVLLD